MNDFEQELRSCKFFQDIIAELLAKQRIQHEAAMQSAGMIATAAARQLDAAVFAQNLERMEALFAHQAPNEARSEILDFAIGLVRNSGTKAGPQAMN